MLEVLTAIAGLMVAGLLAVAAWMAWRVLVALLRGVFQIGTTPPELPDTDRSRNSMNEGDYHSGPGGYEPNTAYPDTHYGDFGRDE